MNPKYCPLCGHRLTFVSMTTIIQLNLKPDGKSSEVKQTKEPTPVYRCDNPECVCNPNAKDS